MNFKKYKIAFLGSDEIAIPFLNCLEERVPHCELSAVLTQPDRPSGRGRKVQPNPVKSWAIQRSLPISDPPTPGSREITWLKGHEIDLLLVMAYGRILKNEMLSFTRYGCFNLHASLLPSYRGASPIETSIACGEVQSGVTFMRVVRKMDAGPILDYEKVRIEPNEVGLTLREKISSACIPLVERSLKTIFSGKAREYVQDEKKVSYCRKLNKSDAILDFSKDARSLDCRIRAFKAWPGTVFIHRELSIRVGTSTPLDDYDSLEPGQIDRDSQGRLIVGTAQGSLRFDELQKPGGRMIRSEEFLRGYDLPSGSRLKIITSKVSLVSKGKF